MTFRLPIRLPPLLFIPIFNFFHMANIINAIGLSMYIVHRFDAGDFEVGLLGTVQSILYGMLAWGGGLMADRFTKRGLIIIGLLLLALGCWRIPHANSVGAVIALAGFCSVVQVIVFPSYYSWIAETVAPTRLARVLGINGVSLVVSAVLAAFFVGRVIERFGAAAAFDTSACLALAIATFATIFAIRPDEGAHRPSTSLVSGSQNRHPPDSAVERLPFSERRAFLIAALTISFTGFFLALVNQTFLVRLARLPEYPLSLAAQSNIHSGRMISGAIGYAIGSLTVLWHWRQWPFWILAAWMTSVTIGAFLAPNPLALGAAIALGGAASSLSNQMALYYAVGGGVVKPGRGAGLAESALALGGGSGPFLGGLAAQWAGTPRAALLMPLIPLLICVLIWHLLWRKPPTASAQN